MAPHVEPVQERNAEASRRARELASLTSEHRSRFEAEERKLLALREQAESRHEVLRELGAELEVAEQLQGYAEALAEATKDQVEAAEIGAALRKARLDLERAEDEPKPSKEKVEALTERVKALESQLPSQDALEEATERAQAAQAALDRHDEAARLRAEEARLHSELGLARKQADRAGAALERAKENHAASEARLRDLQRDLESVRAMQHKLQEAGRDETVPAKPASEEPE